jgi:hypothetical protein
MAAKSKKTRWEKSIEKACYKLLTKIHQCSEKRETGKVKRATTSQEAGTLGGG